MRGADGTPAVQIDTVPLYPRVRGADAHNHLHAGHDIASTPACAGLTDSSMSVSCGPPLYPRVRGADTG